MKKQIAILLMALLIVTPMLQDVTATKTVFITTDNIVDHDFDTRLINAIKQYVEEISDGELQVVVDNEAPAAGEGYRSIEVTSDISIDLAAADAGNFLQLGNYSAHSDKQIIFVNIGDYDLDNSSNYLRRAWDDNYSNQNLAGMHDPGTYLKSAGIYYVQPAQKYPDNFRNGVLDKYDDEMVRDISQQIVDIANNYDPDSKVHNDDLIETHKMPISKMANASKELVNSNDTEFNGTYGGYTGPQLLYVTSCYLNGNGIDVPRAYDAPEKPMGLSFMASNTYSVYDYFKMAGIVKNYMDEHGRAPDSIEYNGAHIGYYDLLYNFAKITENQTSASSMGFEREYHFEKVNSSILVDLFPVIIVLFLIFLVYLLYRKIRKV